MAVLTQDIVQIWQIPLQVSSAHSNKILRRYRDCLSADEKSKADRFRFLADKRRFIMARGTLRYLLGHQLNQPPQPVTFCYGKYGKPAISLAAESSCNFHFNLSHSGEMALCALGYERTVGVDIERVKPIKRLDGLMMRTLVSSEQRQIEAEAQDAQSEAFLQRWTCKEAYLKAIGLGLTQSMQTVEVQLSPPKLLRVPERCAEGWRLHIMPLPRGYVGALAVAGEIAVTQHQWHHETIGQLPIDQP